MSLAVSFTTFCWLIIAICQVLAEPLPAERELIDPPPPERELIDPPSPERELIAPPTREVHRRSKRMVTAAEKDEVLNAHNNFRRNPTASDMDLLKWNDYLASWADTWAAGCKFAHGQPPEAANSSSLLGYSNIGQNLYVISGVSSLNTTKGTTSWYNEYVNYIYENNTCKTGKVCGHYTQVVWSTSYEMGCSYAFCPTITPINWSNAYLMVCNYGKAGNYVGVKPYTSGSSCAACPSDRPYCNNGLCDVAA